VTSEEDRFLVERCIANEPGAWRVLVDRFAGTVRALGRKYLGLHGVSPESADLDDVVQEVFVALTRKEYHLLRRYDPRYSFKTYLGVITRTEVHRTLRKRRPIPSSEETLEGAAPPLEPSSEAAEKAEELDALTKALEALPPRDSEVIRLRYLRGLDYRAIAVALGIPEASVGQTLHRAKQRLLEKLRRLVGLLLV